MKFYLFFLTCAVLTLQVYSQSTLKRIKLYEYYDIRTNKIAMTFERIYLNDSIFYEARLYKKDTTIEKIVYDTFKVSSDTWYYVVEGKFEIFFDKRRFINKIVTIHKAVNSDRPLYGYGPCNSYYPKAIEKVGMKKLYKFFINYGDCIGNQKNGRIFNPEYKYFDEKIGFVRIKDKNYEYRLRVLKYY